MDNFQKQVEKDLKEYKKLRKAWSFLDYSYDTGMIDKETYNFIHSKVGNTFTIHGYTRDYLEDILNNRLVLSDNYGKAIALYDNHKFSAYVDSYENNDIGDYIMEFFKYMNCHKLYEKLLDKDMVAVVERVNDSHAGGYCTEFGRLSYIVHNDCNNAIYLGSGIAHEMGHALVHYILSRDKQYFYDIALTDEIVSLLFEKAFLDFLMENSHVNKKILKKQLSNTEYKYYDITVECKEALDAIDNPKARCTFDKKNIKYSKDGVRCQNYYQYNNHAIGNILSAKLLSENEKDHRYFIKHLNDLIWEFEETPPDEVIDKFTDIDALSTRLDRVLIKK